MMTMGRHAEAIARMKNSQELDPLSLIINVAIGWASLHGPSIRRSHRTTPANCRIRSELPHDATGFSACSTERTGRCELAIAAGEKGVNLSGGSPLMRAALAHTYGKSGRAKEALQVLDDLTELARHKYVAAHFFAGIHIGLGENDRAMEYLEKSWEEHCHWLIYLHIDPTMDDLRNDARFQGLLKRVGLPPGQAE